MTAACAKTPLGWIRIEEKPGRGFALAFCKERSHRVGKGACARLAREVAEYFAGKRRRFSRFAIPSGSAFDRKVWTKLASVPFGRTVSYTELARLTGSPKAARAVGSAMRRNPLPIVVPCHRVLAHGGKLGGYSLGLARKEWLLRHEGAPAR